jgi:putative ABC transport system permease protein
MHLRAFRTLLRLFPEPFRDACGEEMTAFFADRLTRARSSGAAAVIRLWLSTALDLLACAAAERARPSVRPLDTPRGEPMSAFLYDLRHAARRLLHAPAFTLPALLILAIGIGLNATVFNLADTLLYRPGPFADPDRLVHVYQDGDDGVPSSTAFPAYRDIAEYTVFSGVTATSGDDAVWERSDGPQNVSVTYATASYFPVLGLAPHAGRWFAPEHDRVGGEMAAVVSHRTWTTQLGGDPNVLGETVRLNNQLVTIIGIGPDRFNGEAGALVTDFWLSISSTPVGGPFRVANLDRREDHWYQVKARLAPGAGLEQARAAMSAAALRMGELYPELDEGRGITVYAWDDVRFHPSFDASVFNVNVALWVIAGLILLLACSNLMNLLLVRAISRAPEIAVREALGAGRARVARLLLLESLLLASLGGAVGLTLGAWAMRVLPALPIPTPGGALDTGFDGRVLAFGLMLTIATGLFFGLAPALRTARTDVATALRGEGRGRSAGRRTSLLRGALVIVQVAVSIVLVVGAGLLTRSLANAQRVNPGFDADRIAVIGTNLPQGGVQPDEFEAVTAQLLERLGALPGVQGVALTTRLPVSGGGSTTQEIENYRPATGTGEVEVPFAYVSRDYFQTMGVATVAGRTFNPDDRRGSPRVVVVNEAAAQRYWNGSALGGRMRGQGAGEDGWVQVVGVVRDVKTSSLQEPPTPMVFYSADQATIGGFSLVARASGDPAALTGALQNALKEVRGTLPVTRLLTMEAHLGAALAQPRLAAALLGGFSLLGLLLAALGVYAVVAFSVERRTQELGIRAALGASAASIMRMVVGQSLATVLIGIAAGLALAFVAVRGMQGMLFGVGAADPATFVTASVLLLAAATVAAFLPARQAARADPVDALRSR